MNTILAGGPMLTECMEYVRNMHRRLVLKLAQIHGSLRMSRMSRMSRMTRGPRRPFVLLDGQVLP